MGTVEGEFENFVATRYAHLVRAARLVAADSSLAEDLVQAALIRTFAHWSSLHSPAAAESYTHTTLVRLAMRGRRRRWRGERPTDPLPELPTPDAFAARDNVDAVRRALAALPLNQRAVLVLRYYAQLTEAEIGWALRCPVGTVKSRANRALNALREGGLLDPSAGILEATDD